MTADRTNVRHANNIHDIGRRVLSGSSDRMRTAPEVRQHHIPGPDHPPSADEMQEASLSVNSLSQPTDSQRRDDMIAKLDHIRDLYETSKLNRVRYMAEARRAGLSFYEIGIVLGITDDAVRKAVARAGDLG